MPDDCHAVGHEQKLLAIGSAVSTVAFIVAVCFYARRPLLMRRQEGSFLLLALAIGEVFNVVCVYHHLFNDPTVPCPAVVWLRQFGLLGSSFYYLALSLHLRRATLNPFAYIGYWRFHTAAWLGAVAYVTAVESFADTEPGQGQCACTYLLLSVGSKWVMPLLFVTYFCAIRLVLRAWRHIKHVTDSVFTEQRRVIAFALLTILRAEAVYVLVIFVLHGAKAYLPAASPASRWVLSTYDLFLSLQDAHGSLWLILVYYRSARAFEQAVENDTHGGALKPECTDLPELSFGLRRMIVQFIARANQESVDSSLRESKADSHATFSVLSTIVLSPEYKRTKEISIQEVTNGKVESFAPRVFHELRALFDIDPKSFVDSISEETHECFTEGKSGAFLYFTRDKRFIIKTTTPAEFRFLLRLLPRYYQHVLEHPGTLINRILGAYKLHLYGQHVQVVVIESVFQTQRPIDTRYDLKGSWVRSASRGDRLAQLSRWKRGKGPIGDVLTDVSMRGPLCLESQDAAHLGATLRKDVKFLADCGIMDYSLLLGVSNTAFQICSAASANRISRNKDGSFMRRRRSKLHDPAGDPQQRIDGEHQKGLFFRQEEGGMRAAYVEGPEIYYLGLVDILQEFTFRKRVEYFVRCFLLCRGRGVSCIPPDAYKERFVENVVVDLIETQESQLAQSPSRRRVSVARPSGQAGAFLSDALHQEMEMGNYNTAPQTASCFY